MRITLSLLVAVFVSNGCSKAVVRSERIGDDRTDFVIRGVTVVDVESGSLRADRTVLVRGTRVVAVDSGSRDLPNGVTGVRDMATWTPLAEVRQLRADVQAGREIGPRFVTGGPLIDGEPALFEEYLAVGIVERARYHGLPFVGHVPLATTAGEASDLGMRSVEHAYRHRMACATAETEIRRLLVGELEAQRREDVVARERLADSAFLMGIETYDGDTCVALGARFARNGTWFVPTLVEMRSRFLPEPRTGEEFDSLFTQPKLLDMPRSLVARWRDQEMYQRGVRDRAASTREQYDAAVSNRAREVETRLRMTADLHRGGAGILAGTDAALAFPLVMLGTSLHEELALLVQAGLTPLQALQALQAATLNPARFFNATDSLGTVATGKVADLVLLDANPLADIRNTLRIHGVVLNGRWFDRVALDAQLARARRAANPKP